MLRGLRRGLLRCWNDVSFGVFGLPGFALSPNRSWGWLDYCWVDGSFRDFAFYDLEGFVIVRNLIIDFVCKNCQKIFRKKKGHYKYCSNQCSKDGTRNVVKLWVSRNIEKIRARDKRYYYKNRVKETADSLDRYHKKYKHSSFYRDKRNEYSRSYYSKKNKLKHSARTKLMHAVRDGLIVKPINCAICYSDKNIEAHHSDYLKPFDVLWLCKKCHHLEHRRLRDKARL